MPAFTVNSNTKQLALVASKISGLNQNVVLAQWTAEEGQGTTKGPGFWPSNNPAGIRPGDPYVDSHFAIGTNAAGFDIFPDPLIGAEAYGYMYAKDPNYANVRTAIKTGNPQKELAAIANSPWGTNPQTLYQAYNEVTGANVSYGGTSVLNPGSASTALASSNAKVIQSGLAKALGLGSVNWTEVLIVVGGTILIILLLYRLVTK